MVRKKDFINTGTYVSRLTIFLMLKRETWGLGGVCYVRLLVCWFVGSDLHNDSSGGQKKRHKEYLIIFSLQ